MPSTILISSYSHHRNRLYLGELFFAFSLAIFLPSPHKMCRFHCSPLHERYHRASQSNAMKSFNKRSSSSGIQPGAVQTQQRRETSGGSSGALGPLSPRSPAACTTPTAGSGGDRFSARRSARVSTKKFAEGDNDTWHENLAVIENPQAAGAATTPSSSGRESNDGGNRNSNNDGNAATDAAVPQLTLRSYFQSKSTGQRVWDEPPSGASHVVYASEEVRRMATIQMEDLQVSTDVVRQVSATARAEDDTRRAANGDGSSDKGRGKSSAGGKSSARSTVLGRFKIGGRQSSSSNDGDNNKTKQRLRPIRYKPGRAPYGATAAYSESINDAQLERAKMLSLQELSGSGGGSGGIIEDDEEEAAIAAAMRNSEIGGPLKATPSEEEEEEAAIAMAMAISLSEAEAQKAELSPVAASVDEMRRAGAAAAGSSSRPDPPEREHQYGHGGHRNGSTSTRNSPSLLSAARSSSLRYRGKSSSAAVDDDRKPSARNLC